MEILREWIRTIINYSDTLVLIKYYVFKEDNVDCLIIDSEDCHIFNYYYKKGKLIKSETYNPVKNSSGKVIKHELVDVETKPKFNPFIWHLPDYLKQ